MNKLLYLNRITDAQNLHVSRYFGNAVLCVSKKCERSKVGLCGGLKILRCWFDTNRSHGCRFDSCGEAAVDKFNSYQAIGHVVCQPIKVGVAVASHFLLHTTATAWRRAK